MMIVTAVQERGWIGKFAEGTVGGVWHWSLTGPAPASLDQEDGGAAVFQVDEVAFPGEYIVTVQRLDSNGGPLGDSQSSQPFTIAADGPAATVDIEIAGLVAVTVTKG